MENFYNKLAEALDIEEVTPESLLRDIPEWDSLSVLSVLAMIDSSYGVNISSEELANVRTAADLSGLVEARRK
jgi:acyl carrier protein